MASQDDIDSLNAMIARGITEVRMADGRTVKYRTVSEMIQAVAHLRGEMESATTDDRTVFSEYASE